MKANCEKQQSCRKRAFHGHGSWGGKSYQVVGDEFTSMGALGKINIVLQMEE